MELTKPSLKSGCCSSSGRAQSRRSQRGFSLLEMVVAIAILALSLGALYQATSGATHNVRSAEKYAYGVELARSVLANNAQVPRDGISVRGKTEGGFTWSAISSPVEMSRSNWPKGALHNLKVVVSWQDGVKKRQVVLDSVVGGYAR